MKKFILGSVLSAVLATQSVKAGDREWAVVGKVLTGVATFTVIDRIVNPPQPVVVYQQPVVVYQQPVVVYQQPVVVYQQPVVVYHQPVVVQPTPTVAYVSAPHTTCVQPATVVYYYAQPTVGVYPGHYRPLTYHRHSRNW